MMRFTPVIAVCGLMLIALFITGHGTPPSTVNADTTAPSLVSATVDGTSLVLTYDEELDEDSSPDRSAYAVEADGTSLTVSGVVVSGTTVTLTFSSAVSTGAVVTVTYAAPSTDPVQDGDGNQAAALTAKNVVNNTSGTLVSNTGQDIKSTLQVGTLGTIEYSHAQKFTTGVQRGDYKLSGVKTQLSNVGNQAVPKVSIFTDKSGEPGSSLYVLTNPGTIVSGSLITFAAPEDATLEAKTSYWVVFENESTGGTTASHYRVISTDTGSEDTGAVSEWSIGDDRLRRLRDDDDWDTHSDPLRIGIEGIINPDAALASLKLDDLDENPIALHPNFSYRETFYTAYSIPEVPLVTLKAEKSDDGATVEYLDRDGSTITDEDTETDGLQLSVSAGDTTIRVKVTAPDAVTSLTYTLVVTRLPTSRKLVANFGQENYYLPTADNMRAQGFKTGTNARGYLLSSVGAEFRSAGSDILVRIVPAKSNNLSPDFSKTTEIVTLSNPDTIRANEKNYFSAPPGTTLKPNSVYYVVITDAAGTGHPDSTFLLTFDRDEDDGGVDNWAVQNHMVWRGTSTDSWTYNWSQVLKIQVNGIIISSADATLRDLIVEDPDGNAVALTPSFSPGTLFYQASVPFEVDEVTLTSPASHPNATFLYRTAFFNDIGDNNTSKEGHQVGLSTGRNTILIKVTAEDKKTEKEIELRVTRGQPNSNAKLDSLALKYEESGTDTDVALTQAFQNNVYSYTASVPHGVDRITVSGIPEDEDATVDYLDDTDTTITDADENKEGRQVALTVGENTIKVKVTAEDGDTTRTYTVVVTRADSGIDVTAPALVSAKVASATLVLTYDEELDGDSSPDKSAYAVEAEGTSVTVSGVVVSGTTVTLTLSSAVSTGAVVTVTYTVPATGPVQDGDGNQALALAGRSVVNNTGETLVANTGQSADGTLQTGVLGTIEYSHAQQFTTGDQRGDYRFTAVVAPLSNVGSSAVPKVSIFTDDSGEPGSSLYVLTNPGSIVSGSLNTFAAPEGAKLEAKTSYWVVFENESTGGTTDNHYLVQTTDSDSEDADPASEWSIGDDRLRRLRDGDTWNTHSDALRIAIEGIINSDAALASLNLEDSDENPIALHPNFSYRETFYTAYSIPEVPLVTLKAEKSDDGATVEYLDRDGSTITDEDTETDGLQLSVSAGDTTIRVKVTAPDAVTSLTYTLVVTRLPTSRKLVANFGQENYYLPTADNMRAQGFKTGTNARGYLLSSVGAEFRSAGSDILVRIVPAKSNNLSPDFSKTTEIVTLSNPDTIRANEKNYFSAPPGTTLKPNSVYYVVITDAAGTGHPDSTFLLTFDRDEDDGGVDNWAVQNHMVWRGTSTDSWTYNWSQVLKIQVNGIIISSADATLRDLIVEDPDGNAVALTPSFSPGTLFYQASVPSEVDEVTLTSPASHPNASFLYRTAFFNDIGDNNTSKEGHQVGLSTGRNTILIKVTAEDKKTEKEIELWVTRGQPNSNAKLDSLALKYEESGTDTDVALTQAFQNNVYSYTASVPHSADRITVSGIPEDEDATVDYLDDTDTTITDADENKEGRQVALTVGENTIKVKVTAENGNTTRTYTVVVTRPAARTDATLSALSASYDDGGTGVAVTLTPGFESAVYGYSASVDYDIDTVTIAATKNDQTAGIAYLDANDNTIADADGIKRGLQTPLAVGPNTIKVKVTAEDGDTILTYTVSVTRTAPSTDATLSNLELSYNDAGTDAAAALNPAFQNSDYDYTATVEHPVAEITISATKNDSNANIDYLDGTDNVIADADGNKGGLQAAMAVGPNTIKVKVTAEDNDTILTYTVVITRVALSTDATLSDLAVSYEDGGGDTAVSLNPAFQSGGYDYTAAVDDGVDEITVNPTKGDDNAGIVYLDASDSTLTDTDGNKPGLQTALTVGANTVKVKVTAEDNDTFLTYTVVITRTATRKDPEPEPPPRDNPEPDGGDDCERDERNGAIATCIVTGFAVVRVEHNGDYTIDWSSWDSDHPDVTGYTILLNEMLYKNYYDGDAALSDSDLADVYESCEYRSGLWNCEGPLGSNYFEDWHGNPTRPEQLASNEDRTQWNSALDRPGVHVHDRDFARWSGDATDPNNEPVSVTYRVKVFEIDFYYVNIHEGNQTGGREVVGIGGATGFD